MSIYQFAVNDVHGREILLSRFQGKVVLIVNTASQCGYTPQYAGLQRLYTDFRDLGLEILAFPCDQFGHQEPGTDDEIQQFCQRNYRITFPVFSKIEVNGPESHPLYLFLTSQTPGPHAAGNIRWNFTKFLINQKGEIVQRFEPGVKPEEIVPDIQKLLANR